MRNALFYGLLGLVIAILALIGYGIYLDFAQEGADITRMVCGAGFVLVALIAWEVLMKPGYHRRRRAPGVPEEPQGPEGPKSP